MRHVGPTNDKEHGGMVGVLKDEEGRSNNLNVSDFQSSWNSTYMKNVRKQMLNGESRQAASNAIKKKQQGTIVSVCGRHITGHSVKILIN